MHFFLDYYLILEVILEDKVQLWNLQLKNLVITGSLDHTSDMNVPNFRLEISRLASNLRERHTERFRVMQTHHF